MLNQNKDLSDEARHFKLETSNLQRSLNDYELTSRERDRLQGKVAELEVYISWKNKNNSCFILFYLSEN